MKVIIPLMVFLVSCGVTEDEIPSFTKAAPPKNQVHLGRLLFHDKILSGNKNISCSTCHHVLAASGDGLSLPVGEGGCGFASARVTRCNGDRIHERVPRNSPSLFNAGEEEFKVMFADGRVAMLSNGRIDSPAKELLPDGLDSALAAQALFPITSGTEMAGQRGENLQGDLADIGDFEAIWSHVVNKLKAIPDYVRMFEGNITPARMANAIAAFEAEAFRATDSPYDRYLNGDESALSLNAKLGMEIFNGKGRCHLCHSGKFQTNHRFASIGMVQIGPGKGDGDYGMEDFGREQVTGKRSDRYKFRVPSLRNVAHTGPWGHCGSYNSLRAIIKHHLDPVFALENWSVQNAVLPWDQEFDRDFLVHSDFSARDQIALSSQIPDINLTEREIDRLIDFLESLTDTSSLNIRHHMPDWVPSGLPIFD